MLAPPSAILFKTRYPLFKGLDDALINLVLNEVVSSFVDETWLEADQIPAILALAAHFLAMEGHPFTEISDDTGSGSNESVITTGALSSIKVGDVSVSYGSGSSATGGGISSSNSSDIRSNLNLTTYGQQFLSLRRKNFPAVVVV